MASQLKDTQWLQWIAGLMSGAPRERFSSALPSDQFHCLLDDLPLHLIPSGILDKQHFSGPLFLNPKCSLWRTGGVPQEFLSREDLLKGFCRQCAMVWVRDAAKGTLDPFWVGPCYQEIISQLHLGEPVPDSLAESVKFRLALANILIPAGQAERRASKWAESMARSAQKFHERNYAPLRELIHPFNLAALRRYYRTKIRRGKICLGDDQSSRRYVAHNEPVARYFHYQIANIVSAVVGEPVKPSYVYLASYLSGAELKQHTDREQCEFSVTLCLDFSPEPEGETSWPLHLDTPDGTVTVYQALGDGLVYRGTRLPHYRGVLRKGFTSTSIFFHYVPLDFSGTLD